MGKEGNETGLVELKQQQGTIPNEEDAEEMLADKDAMAKLAATGGGFFEF